MIVWRGYGIATLLLIGAALLIGGATRPVFAIVALAIVAVINWFVGINLNAPLRAAGYGDRLHSLFWIPMEYWSVAILAYAAFGVTKIMGLI